MSIEFEKNRESARERERNYEVKENKEAETDKELQAAAALERADYLVGEVKSSKKQMQNIMVHMQQVLAAIKELREQLQLAPTSGDDASVVQDKKRVEQLKHQIAEYKDELSKMKDELIAGYMQEMQKKDESLSGEVYKQRAEELVKKIMQEIEQ